MSPSNKWLFFPTPVSASLGDIIVTNGIINTRVGGVENRVNSDGSSTVYNSWTLGNMDFRDASKNAAWTDDGLGLLWNMSDSTNYANWQGYIGAAGGTFYVYEEGTSTLIFSMAYTDEKQFTTNMRQYGATSRDFTGDTGTSSERVDVYHVQA